MIRLVDRDLNTTKIIPSKHVFDAWQTMEINKVGTLESSVSLKYDQDIQEAHHMAVRDKEKPNEYFIYKLQSDDAKSNHIDLRGIELGYDDMRTKGYIEDYRPNNRSVTEVANRLADGTGWEVRFVDSRLPNVTTNFYHENRLAAFSELIKLTGAEIEFKVEITGRQVTAKMINLYYQQGEYRGKRFVYGHSALTVERERDQTSLFTAFVGRGHGEQVGETEDGDSTYGRRITFEDVEWSVENGDPVDKPLGQKYVEIPEATVLYGHPNGEPRMDIREYDDIEEPEALLRATYEDLVEEARPKVQFSSTVKKFGDTEKGEPVVIIRKDINIAYQTRVYKVRKNLKMPEISQITVGDKLVNSPGKRQNDLVERIRNVENNTNNSIERIRREVSLINAEGVRITWSEEEPETAALNDIWYQLHPDGSETMHRWNGDFWEETQSSRQLNQNANAIEEITEEVLPQLQAQAEYAFESINTAIENSGLPDLDSVLSNANSRLEEIEQDFEDYRLREAYEIASGALDTAAESRELIGDLDEHVSREIRELDDGISAINTHITNVDGEINTLQSQYTATSEELSAVLSEINDSEYGLTALRTELTSVAGELNRRVSETEMNRRFEELTVGGRNYFGQFLSTNLDVVNEKVRNSPFHIRARTNWSYVSIPLPELEELMISGYFKSETGESNFRVSYRLYTDEENYSTHNEYFGNSSDWSLFKIEGIDVSNVVIIRIYLRDDNSGNTTLVDSLMVQSGNRVTDWTPAPEDVEDSYMYHIESNINQLSDQIGLNVWDSDGNFAEAILSLDQWRTTLTSSDGLLTEAEQTIDGFRNTIFDPISGDLVQTESNINGLMDTVYDADEGLMTQVTTLAEGWQVISSNTQQNILRNGDFSDGYSAWSFGTDVDQRGISDSGILTVFLENANGSTTGNANRFWTRPEPRFREGQSYQITFEARTAGTREVSVGQAGGEYNVRCRITSDWQTFSVTYEADRDSDFSIFIHHRGTFYFRNFHVIPVGGASSGQLAVLNNQIAAKVSSGDVYSQLLLDAEGILFDTSENLVLSADNVVFDTNEAFIPTAILEMVDADYADIDEVDFGRMSGVSIDVSRIVGGTSEFVRTQWNSAVGGNVTIGGNGIESSQNNATLTLAGGQISSVGGNQRFDLDHRTLYIGADYDEAEDNVSTSSSNGGPQETGVLFSPLGIRFMDAGSTIGNVRTERFDDGVTGLALGSSAFPIRLTGGVGPSGHLVQSRLETRRGVNVDFVIAPAGTGRLQVANTLLTAYYPVQARQFILENELDRIRVVNNNMRVEARNILEFSAYGSVVLQAGSNFNMLTNLNMRGNNVSNVGNLSYNSDERLKNHVTSSTRDALSIINKVHYVDFTWKESGERQHGLIAQELILCNPELVSESDDGYLNINLQSYVDLVGEALQQHIRKTNNELVSMNKKIEALDDYKANKSYVEQLEKELKEVKEEVKRLKSA